MIDEQNKRPISTADMANVAQKTELVSDSNSQMRTQTSTEEQPVPLLHQEVEEDFRSRWTKVQAEFVDDPRWAVEQADSLVAELMKEIAEMFAAERSNLEEQWTHKGNGDGNDLEIEPNTEDLRIALQHYRSFFNRLLSFDKLNVQQ